MRKFIVIKSAFIALLATLVVGAAQGQSMESTQGCNPLIDASTPATRYDFGAAAGTALDMQLT